MHHRLIYQSAAFTLDYDAVDDCLRAIWAPEQDLGTTRTGYEQILTQLSNVHCHRLLDDRRQAHLMWDELAAVAGHRLVPARAPVGADGASRRVLS